MTTQTEAEGTAREPMSLEAAIQLLRGARRNHGLAISEREPEIGERWFDVALAVLLADAEQRGWNKVVKR